MYCDVQPCTLQSTGHEAMTISLHNLVFRILYISTQCQLKNFVIGINYQGFRQNAWKSVFSKIVFRADRPKSHVCDVENCGKGD
jgi:hypothetical protein